MASVEQTGLADTEAAVLRSSSDTIDKVIKAKVALENFYTNLLAQHSDRQNRSVTGSLNSN